MLNQPISPEQLPSLTMLSKQPLSDNYARINAVVNISVFTILILASLTIRYFGWLDDVGMWPKALPFLHWIIMAFGFLVVTYRWFSDKAKFYALREHDISFYSGLFFKKLVTQPACRIQHVEVSQGPLDRLAKLATLQVYSAGSGLQTFGIPGLPQALAHQLRQSLTEQLVASEDDKLDHGE